MVEVESRLVWPLVTFYILNSYMALPFEIEAGNEGYQYLFFN